MNPRIVKEKDILKEDKSKGFLGEFFTDELCFILENWNNSEKPDVSIARARVKPGVTTKAHYLKGTDEVYLITGGKGRMKVGNLAPTNVGKGDLVFIPAGVSQQITNVGDSDLIFYCICNPRFVPECNVFI